MVDEIRPGDQKLNDGSTILPAEVEAAGGINADIGDVIGLYCMTFRTIGALLNATMEGSLNRPDVDLIAHAGWMIETKAEELQRFASVRAAIEDER